MLIFGLILCVGSLLALLGLYTWAAWDWRGDSDKPLGYRRPVRHVEPRYLLMGGIGALVGLLLMLGSQSH